MTKAEFDLPAVLQARAARIRSAVATGNHREALTALESYAQTVADCASRNLDKALVAEAERDWEELLAWTRATVSATREGIRLELGRLENLKTYSKPAVNHASIFELRG